MMRTAIETKSGSWDDELPYMMFAIATHEVDHTGISPFEIKHGLPATLPGDLLIDSIALPSNLREHYRMAQKAMLSTREYFRADRVKTRIRNQLLRNQRTKRYKTDFQVNDWVFVTKPSFTRVDGVKGLTKTQGKHLGPFRITKVTPHNTVFVDLDGVETDFNVMQLEKAHTPLPLNRDPPSYEDGSIGNAELDNKIQSRAHAIVPEGLDHSPPTQPANQNSSRKARAKTLPRSPTVKKEKRPKANPLHWGRETRATLLY